MSSQTNMVENKIQAKLERIESRHKKGMRRAEEEARMLRALPELPGPRWIPRVFWSNIKSLDWHGLLTWGGSFRTEEKFTDDEVVTLMELFPPMHAALKCGGGTSFVPIPHEEAWYAYWKESEVILQNNLRNKYTPVAPFWLEMETSENVSASLFVEWFTLLDGKPVKCKVHLNVHRDASSLEYGPRYYGHRGKPVGRKFERLVPNVCGDWKQVKWATGSNDPLAAHVAIYWPWPDEESMTWKSVIDHKQRVEHKEKLRERERQD
jgi:hypothetical protein